MANRLRCLATVILLTLIYPLISLLTRDKVISVKSSNHLHDNDLTRSHHHHEHDNDLNNLNSNSNNNEALITRGKGFPHESLEDIPPIPLTLVHLDLKGAPPLLSYLTNHILPIVTSFPNTGVLIEYEDTFPFTSTLQNISHTNHYLPGDLKLFLRKLKELKIPTIPLVQTFGHLEFLLKHKQFKGLREVNYYPQEICPSNSKAKGVVRQMLDQIVGFHRNVFGDELKYLHVGLDEVFHIGICPLCRDRENLFLERVKEVIQICDELKVRCIMWDDELRKLSPQSVLEFNITKKIDIMLWDYTSNPDNLIPTFLYPLYRNFYVWIASSFKGAFGESLYKVNYQRHAENHIAWLQVLKREKFQYFRGFAITGWSRYDHFSVICELLPEAVPSLVLCLEILKERDLNDAVISTGNALKCSNAPKSLEMFSPDFCAWKGSELHELLNNLFYLETSVEELMGKWGSGYKSKGWLNVWNVKHNQTASWRIQEVKYEVMELKHSLKSLEVNLRGVLASYYASFVIDEWIEQRLSWLYEAVDKKRNDVELLLGVTEWQRRG